MQMFIRKARIDFVKKSKTVNPNPKILIVGAGPAGTSAAIRLAQKGFRIALIEREKFPRHKLCGEFISPECFAHFRELGILDEMLAAGGDRITKTIFYAPDGKEVTVSSKYFSNDEAALGLSRAEMDFRLLEKAREIGVEVLEETPVSGLLWENDEICGIKAKNQSQTVEIEADLIIDATGRAGVLAKLAEKDMLRKTRHRLHKSIFNARLIGFKTHLKNASIERGRCEIYFFPGGYGGLNRVENGVANHCFLIKAEKIKEFGSSDAENIVREIIFQNKRAFEMLANASPVYDWLAVSIDRFGAKNLNPAPHLLAIGDAGAFIDPFTGSGMLMALESGKILAQSIDDKRFSVLQIAESYKKLYAQNFQKRLYICKLMRRAAFNPNLAKMIISILGWNQTAVGFLAKATRTNFSVLKK